ncbi:MAG: tetraacyldisaccharide 4'-kinase [Psychromonas sp.]|nr:tetraacyldisaccharide 4'-kinase [Psychromonas sp.]
MPFWYQRLRWWAWFLYPFAFLFWTINSIRYWLFKSGIFKRYKSTLPVIVVGNISVGGNGKTPFVIWLCTLLIKKGYKPGIVSRGYGGKSKQYPLLVEHGVTGSQAGDEPVMIYKRLGIPIVVDPVRSQAVKYLVQQCDVDIIITDDGLQHYALQRDIEIVIVDGKRRFGNEKIMPMGPLRERLSRLNRVDYIISNGQSNLPLPEKNKLNTQEVTMLLVAEKCVRVDGHHGELNVTEAVNACAGIGYPQRFFDSIKDQQFNLKNTRAFADHHAFVESDLEQFGNALPLLMTEKDAIKCINFAKVNWWFMPISAQLPPEFEKKLLTKIKDLIC